MGCINWQRIVLRAADFLVSAVVVLFLITAGAYSAYALWDNAQIYAAVDDVQSELLRFKPAADADNGASFEELLTINPDVRGWLTLDGTSIDYPVLQGETNFTYINTDVYGQFALAGSIFLDSDCDGGFRDDCSLLYGHHMENSRMFGDLDLYKDEAFFDGNTTGTLILPDRSFHLETLACLLVPASEEKIFEPLQWNGDPGGLLDFACSRALNRNEDAVQRFRAVGGGQLLLLSTCSAEFTDARTILLAWMKPSGLES